MCHQLPTTGRKKGKRERLSTFRAPSPHHGVAGQPAPCAFSLFLAPFTSDAGDAQGLELTAPDSCLGGGEAREEARETPGEAGGEGWEVGRGEDLFRACSFDVPETHIQIWGSGRGLEQ